ncbi:MAG TPA: TIGR03621 family F420-dependent LLM class oxidoreductase [Acidimicrobiia bacterium]|nr:TIGR03621 family F420-dependent LLM class oxidoreductase [Acidimicrobiia bacterium]
MSARRPFRFGVQSSSPTDAAGWRERARKIEGLGYSTLLMPDHFVDTELAPMVGLSCAAAATDSLRVGPLVLGNDYKHPAVVAKEAATLDVLSGGRLELGIGAGWLTSDYAALGLPYDDAVTRIERLAEAVEIVRRCWATEAFSFEGAHYTIREYDALPKPLQQPRPPLLMGGGGRQMLTLAGRAADIVGINPNLREGEIGSGAARNTLAAATQRKVDWVRTAAGQRIDHIELQIRYFLAAITDDARGLATAVASSFGVDADDALASGTVLVGTVDEVCDTLVARREQWGVSYVVVGDDQFEAFGPVVARLAGT